MFEKISLVPFLAAKKVVEPLTNVPIMLERSIMSSRHLDC